MTDYKPTQPVRFPSLAAPPGLAAAGEGIIESLYKIEPVRIVAVFDAAPPADYYNVIFERSAPLLETLSYANLKRGTVIELELNGVPVTSAALARLNWFIHVPGYTKGFRGWKIANKAEPGGQVLWHSSHAWRALLEIIKV